MDYKYYIALGGNIGDTKDTFRQVIEKFNAELGEVLKVSKLYKSKPLPTTHGIKQDAYLNAVLLLKTTLDPETLLKATQKIEEDLGRDRENYVYWGPRTIDLDIISVGEIIIDSPTLSIPHSRMNERDFVLLPIMDIDPNYIHPTSKLGIIDLVDALDKNHRYIETIITEP